MIPSSGCPPWPPDHPRTLPRTGSPTPPRGARPMSPVRSSGLNPQGRPAGERQVSDDLLPVDADLSNPPPYAVPLITAYGLAALNWGRLEAILDDILIHTDPDAKQAGVPTRIPNNWSDKCDALARRFELPRIAALVPVAARIGPERFCQGS